MITSKELSNKKRTASEAGMGLPDKQSAKKKTKLDTELGARLTRLQEALDPDNLNPDWEDYDPLCFMEEMRRLGGKINGLTLETVADYVTNGSLRRDLVALDTQEMDLKQPLGPVNPEYLEVAQANREQMIEYVAMVRTCLNVLVDQANVKPPPHEFADSKQWRVYQEKQDAILCLRPAKKRGLPISLMHAAFCNFTRHFHEPLLDEHTARYLSMADDLCEAMPSAFDSESDRRDAFEKIFHSLDMKLKRPLIDFSLSAKVSTAKVAKAIDCEGGHLVLLLEDFKMESIEDVYMQICRSYEVFCGEAKNERLLKFGNPTFLLCVLGPYLMVSGAIKRDNVHVEPLTPFLPMFPGFGIEGWPVKIAHCLRALKQGLDALKEFWQDVGIAKTADQKATANSLPKLYMVPHCPDNTLLRFDDWRGTFESPMPGNNSDKPPRFLANIHKANECHQVVVKFVYNYSGTYGTAVHEYLQDCGLAPVLHWART